MSRQPRPIRIEGDIAFVPLTKGYEAVIDATDAGIVGQWRWLARETPWSTYASRTDYSTGRKVEVKLHRFLLECPVGMEVDHKDRNGLNNCRDNLRLATREQNARNAGVRKDNFSGLRGVGFVARDGRWRARICCAGKTHYLGAFGCQTAARVAYAKASAEVHGSFGWAA